MNDAPKTLPDIVKGAAALLVAHGGLIALNGARAGQLTGDWSSLPKSLIWLGVTIVLSGALCERQAWAWWLVTICGGVIGVFRLLQVVGYFMFQSSGVVEVATTFSPALIGAAGIVLLLSTTLLMTPEAKEVFGQSKPAKTPHDLDEALGDDLGDYEKSNDDSDQKRASD